MSCYFGSDNFEYIASGFILANIVISVKGFDIKLLYAKTY